MTILGQVWLIGLVLVSGVFPGVLDWPTPDSAPTPAALQMTAPAPYPIKQAGAIQPVIDASSALVVDLPSNATLYAKDEDTPRPIASLTKMMTALMVVERTRGDEVVTVPADFAASTPEESRMGLRPGDQLKVEDLLAGMLIASANDASNLLAIHLAGSPDKFVDQMNERARKLGLIKTRFDNPSGYGIGENTGTARDLAVLARAVVRDQRIRGLVTIKEAVITPVKGDPYPIRTTDELLGSYLPIAGLKTGTSDAAGPCLVSLLVSGDRQLMAVVLNSPNRFQENKNMLDWSLRSYRW